MNAEEICLETVESRCRENVQRVPVSEENKLKLSVLTGKSGECWKSGRSGYCSLFFHSSLS